MDRCFVIQPFDGGKFDKRYEDVVAPAIRDAKLEPYRVDRDPSTSIPIDTIVAEIASAAACLCDITLDNPNVWFELGLAIAHQKEVVLICSDERTSPRFPFDVQHRTITKYATDSRSDFEKLHRDIAGRLIAYVEKRRNLTTVAAISPVATVEGLEQFEIAALVSVVQQLRGPDSGIQEPFVQQEMEAAGFTSLAANLGLRSLVAKGLLRVVTMYRFDDTETLGYGATSKGTEWLLANRQMLSLRIGGNLPGTPASDDDDPAF
jgi:hypothetical protein